MDLSIPASSPAAAATPPARRPWRLRLRTALRFDFAELASLDLGTPAEVDAAVAAAFARGPHEQA
ncbi:MAG: hypothetical protein AAF845_17210 [Bacteroidota bacterium]